MKRTTLGQTDLQITALGLGAWAIGGGGRRLTSAVVQRVTAVRGTSSGPEVWLVLRVDPESGERKAFLSNAPESLAPAEVLRVSGLRWVIEHCFEVAKQQLGMGDYEVRGWRGWHHHRTLVLVAHFFLLRLHRRLKKSPAAPAAVALA